MLKLPLTVFAVLTFCVISHSQQKSPEVRTPSSTYPQMVPAARSQWAPHVGIVAGIANPEGSFDSAGEIGLDIGYQPYIPLGIGAEITHYNSSGVNRNLVRTQLLAKATYNFGGSSPLIKHSYVGVGLGPNFRSGGTDLVTAPLIGFDIPLQAEMDRNYFTLGARVKYAFVEGGEPDIFSVDGVLKYWY